MRAALDFAIGEIRDMKVTFRWNGRFGAGRYWERSPSCQWCPIGKWDPLRLTFEAQVEIG